MTPRSKTTAGGRRKAAEGTRTGKACRDISTKATSRKATGRAASAAPEALALAATCLRPVVSLQGEGSREFIPPPVPEALARHLEWVSIDQQWVPVGLVADGAAARLLLSYVDSTIELPHRAAIREVGKLSFGFGHNPVDGLSIRQEPTGLGRPLSGRALWVRSISGTYWTRTRLPASCVVLFESLLDAGGVGMATDTRRTIVTAAGGLSWQRRVSDLRSMGLPISVTTTGATRWVRTSTVLHLRGDDVRLDEPSDGLPIIRARTIGEHGMEASLRQITGRRWGLILGSHGRTVDRIGATYGPGVAAAAIRGQRSGMKLARTMMDPRQTDFLGELLDGEHV